MNQPMQGVAVFRLHGDFRDATPRQCVTVDGVWYTIEYRDDELGWVNTGVRVCGLEQVALVTGALLAIGTGGAGTGWTVFLNPHRHGGEGRPAEVGQAPGGPPH